MAVIASVSPVKTGGTIAKRGEMPSALTEAFDGVCAPRTRATNGRRLTARRPRHRCSEKYMMLFQCWSKTQSLYSGAQRNTKEMLETKENDQTKRIGPDLYTRFSFFIG